MKRDKEKSWFKPKNYLHFSPKLKYDSFNFVKSYIELKDSNGVYTNIAKHAFYPLIHRTILQRRFKKIRDKNGIQLLTETGKTLAVDLLFTKYIYQ